MRRSLSATAPFPLPPYAGDSISSFPSDHFHPIHYHRLPQFQNTKAKLYPKRYRYQTLKTLPAQTRESSNEIQIPHTNKGKDSNRIHYHLSILLSETDKTQSCGPGKRHISLNNPCFRHSSSEPPSQSPDRHLTQKRQHKKSAEGNRNQTFSPIYSDKPRGDRW
jgi:hypothetical protein